MVAKVIGQAQYVYHTMLTGATIFLFAVSPLVPLIWNGMMERVVLESGKFVPLTPYWSAFWFYMVVPTIALILWVNTEVNWKRREEKFSNWVARRASA